MTAVFVKAATPPCMGGWCRLRATCVRHFLPRSNLEPAERLCAKGASDLYLPLVVKPYAARPTA